MILYFVVLGIIPLVLYWRDLKAFLRKVYLAEKLPGPMAYPIVGNAFSFIGIPLAEMFNVSVGIATEYGRVSRIWIGSELFVVLSHPMDAEIILTSSKFVNKSSVYDYMHDWLGLGLLTSKAKKWHSRRKIITPAFHFKILEQYMSIYEKHGNVLLKKLSQYEQTDTIEMHKLMSLYALDVIVESAMGICIDALNNEQHSYVRAVKTISDIINYRICHYLLRFHCIYRLSSMCRESVKCLSILHSFTDNLIKCRRQTLINIAPAQTENDEYEFYGNKRMHNFVDILLQSQIDGHPLSNIDIREEVDTFIFEGHDTTAAAITFALYNIAKYPDVQRKCFAEMRETFGDDKWTAPTIDQLHSLSYLDLVLKETLRLYPSVPVIGRVIEEETMINGYTFPAQTHIFIPINLIGRNPLVFDKPTEFIPERFSVDQTYTGKGKSFAYIPFSAGSRNCIGQKFAELELKSVLTKILRHYEISLHPDSMADPTLLVALILKTVEPLKFHLKERVYE